MVTGQSRNSWEDDIYVSKTEVGWNFSCKYKTENGNKNVDFNIWSRCAKCWSYRSPNKASLVYRQRKTHLLWRCPMFCGKTSTQRAKGAADNNLCFSCLNGQHFFLQSLKPRKWSTEGCSRFHNLLLHGAEKVFPPKLLHRQSKASNSSNVQLKEKSRESADVVA